MALDTKLMKNLLANAIQERAVLDALIANLRKYLQISTNGNIPIQQSFTTKKTSKKGGYHRKLSHATKIYEIITHSEIKMKPREILQVYRDKGLEISPKNPNALTSIYRAIKERPDILTLSDEGYILPVIQQ